MTWSISSIPSQKDRIAFITGANSGLGFDTAQVLLQKGATVIVGCRSLAKAESTRQKLLNETGCKNVEILEIDLADLNKVNKAIDQIPIHLRSKEGLGYLPQQRSVFNLSTYDNIFGICQLYFKDREKQKAITEKLLDEFNLQHLRSLNASVLSGGEVRRVMLARLMINKPKIVLLDEPLAALDPQIIQDIQKYILKIQSSGTAILITDHNVRNLFDITDRSYVISEGQVIAEGTSRELLKSSKAIEHYFGSQFS